MTLGIQGVYGASVSLILGTVLMLSSFARHHLSLTLPSSLREFDQDGRNTRLNDSLNLLTVGVT